MVQFYISSGVIIASLILQFMLIRTAIHTKNIISTEALVRVKPRELTSVNSLKLFKMVIILSGLLLLWSLFLVVIYKELFIGILFLTFLLGVIGLVLLANNLIVSIGLKNEVKLAHIKKMNFEFSDDHLKYLNRQELGIKLSISLLVITNTLGLYFGYSLFNDALWFNIINLLLTFFAYFSIYKALTNQHKVVFANQKDALSDVEVNEFLADSKQKYTLTKDDIKKLLEKEDTEEDKQKTV